MIRFFKPSATCSPCAIFARNRCFRSSSSSAREVATSYRLFANAHHLTTFNNRRVLIQCSYAKVQCLLRVARLFVSDGFLQTIILEQVNRLVMHARLNVSTLTARAISTDRSLTMNGCRKKSAKVIRSSGSRRSKPCSRFRHSGEIRASLGIYTRASYHHGGRLCHACLTSMGLSDLIVSMRSGMQVKVKSGRPNKHSTDRSKSRDVL